jgi:phasin family protein
MAARQTEHAAEEVVRETTRKAADQATRTAREMSDAAERAARTGAETAQRNSEQFLSSWRSSADAANQIAERSLDKWSKMFGLSGDTATQAIQQSFGNTQAVLETTTMLADGFRDLSGEWTRFLQERAEQNLEHFERLMGARNVQEWMASQTEIARDQLEAFLQTARRTSERSTQLADQAARKLTETPLAPR